MPHSTTTLPDIEDLVVLTDPDGGTIEGRVTARHVTAPLAFVVTFDGEEAEFEPGAYGQWYDINDSQTPWTLTLARETFPVSRPTPRTLGDDIDAYVRAIDAASRANYAAQYPSLTPPVLAAEVLSNKWCRITTTDRGPDGQIVSRSVHSFVALTSYTTKGLGTVFAGDIHKAAGWKAPAKHARGSVLDPMKFNLDGSGHVRYMR